MSDLYYAVGDQLPAYTQQLIMVDGSPDDLTGKSVRFVVRRTERHTKIRTNLIDGVATLDPVTQARGWATYTLTPQDAALLVDDDNYFYEQRWRVISGSQPSSYPGDRWQTLTVS